MKNISRISFNLHSPYKPEQLVPPGCGCRLVSVAGLFQWRRNRSCRHRQYCCPHSPSREPNPQSLPLQRGEKGDALIVNVTKVFWTLHNIEHNSVLNSTTTPCCRLCYSSLLVITSSGGHPKQPVAMDPLASAPHFPCVSNQVITTHWFPLIIEWNEHHKTLPYICPDR